MRSSMERILFVAVLVLVGAALAFVLLRYVEPLVQSEARLQLPSGSARDFGNGNGIYYYDEGKYNFLIWKKKLFTPGQPPDEKDIAEAARSAILVKKGVRFFSYGLELSKWPVVPPYAMAFCIIRDPRTIEGVFPIRIKLVDRQEPIYELVPPELISTLTPAVLWAINYQYACTDGWVFKFQ